MDSSKKIPIRYPTEGIVVNELSIFEKDQHSNVNASYKLKNSQFSNRTSIVLTVQDKVCSHTIQMFMGLLVSLQWREKLKIAN